MHRFFASINALNRFSRQLHLHRDALWCGHCRCAHHLVSHGFVYKKRHGGTREPVGKRILCSSRRRSGCGRSFRLYLARRIPRWQHGACVLSAFLMLWLAGLSVVKASLVIGSVSSRHAYRWITRLRERQPVLRARSQFAALATDAVVRQCSLGETLAPLGFASHDPGDPVGDWQQRSQMAFV